MLGTQDRYAAARVLRERYGVLHMQDGRDGAFTLEVTRGRVHGAWLPSLLVSLLTFAIVPGYFREDHELALTLTAPAGERVIHTDRNVP